jgi:hypothetical protein
VFTLRCTKRLLKHLGLTPRLEDSTPTTRLGDWYGNLIFTPEGPIALFASERSLLPVIVPASPVAAVFPWFLEATAGMLQAVGVPESAVRTEFREMSDILIGRTRNRRILGSMNDFMTLIDANWDHETTLQGVALRVAKAPCGPIGMESPARFTRDLFESAE